VNARIAPALVAALLLATAASAQQTPPAAPASPAAQRPKTLKLSLKDLVELQDERGHAEFDLGMRRELWQDPMVRLAVGLSREQAAAARGGLVGAPGPWSATSLLVPMPGADPRLVLAGPFASDWHDLTPQEKVGRVAEQAVYLGLIVGILSNLR
jgi:hypothetical protein